MSKYASEEVLRMSLSSLKYASVTQSTSAKIHLQVANLSISVEIFKLI